MRIAIIGTGNVGSAIARGLKGKGHQVTLGSRDQARATGLAAEVGAAVAAPRDAARGADIVILSLPWRVAEAAVRDLGTLSGKVVIDCMNPLGMVDGALSLLLGHSTSGAEVVQSWIPAAHVVKTLNQTGAENLANAGRLKARPVQFVAGNDAAAKAATMTILRDLGFDALDAGDLKKARILEPFAMVWINQAMLQGKGRNWAFAAVEMK